MPADATASGCRKPVGRSDYRVRSAPGNVAASHWTGVAVVDVACAAPISHLQLPKGSAMPQLNAYLSYDGNCAEAMKFYARVLGAKLDALMTYREMPGDQPVPPSHADRIMHAYLVHPDFALMAGDTPPGAPYQGVHGVMMTLTYPTAAEGRRVFEALAEGGTVNMPLGETFWADSFGMVTDRFGTPWGVNGGSKTI